MRLTTLKDISIAEIQDMDSGCRAALRTVERMRDAAVRRARGATAWRGPSAGGHQARPRGALRAPHR